MKKLMMNFVDYYDARWTMTIGDRRFFFSTRVVYKYIDFLYEIGFKIFSQHKAYGRRYFCILRAHTYTQTLITRELIKRGKRNWWIRRWMKKKAEKKKSQFFHFIHSSANVNSTTSRVCLCRFCFFVARNIYSSVSLFLFLCNFFFLLTLLLSVAVFCQLFLKEIVFFFVSCGFSLR